MNSGPEQIEALRCTRLHWKGMFLDLEPDPGVPDTGDGFFWCNRTMTCLGPDGAPARPSDCGPHRPCYEAVPD